MKYIAALTAIFVLSGCAMNSVDRYGNEARPFGTDESRISASKMSVTKVETRSALIEQCHDMNGHVSKDGLNCVKLHLSALDGKYGMCEVLFVKDRQRDDGWVNAICSGTWNPGVI